MIMHPTSSAFHAGNNCHKLATLAESMGDFDFLLCLSAFAGDQANLCKQDGNSGIAAIWRSLGANAEKLARECP